MPKEKPAPIDPAERPEAVENDPAPCEELPTEAPAKPARIKG